MLASTLPGAQPANRAATSAGRPPGRPGRGPKSPLRAGIMERRPAASVAPITAPTVPVGISSDAFQAAISARSDSSTETPDAVTASCSDRPSGFELRVTTMTPRPVSAGQG